MNTRAKLGYPRYVGGVGDGNDVPTQDLVSQGYKTARVVDGSYELVLTKTVSLYFKAYQLVNVWSLQNPDHY